MSAPLPANPYGPDSMHGNAYDRCIIFEGDAPNYRSQPPALVCARILGYLLIHAPVTSGRDNVAREILSCTNNDSLVLLAKHYIDHFIRCFKTTKGPTPTPSHHPSRPSFDNVRDMLGYLLQESPQDHKTAKLRALARDGYRCLLSGLYDALSFDKYADLQHIAITQGVGVVLTQASHIFPPSINQNISGDNEGGAKYDYAASVWAVVERFGGVLITEELNGLNVHRLENILTMGMDLHGMFDRLFIWLEEDPTTPNRYHIRGKYPTFTLNVPPTVTFTAAAPFPLPDPRYLRIHAACAKIAHLSGAGEYIDAIFRDMEDMRVLAANGSSAEALTYALTAF